jgi:hypothetical protein
MERPFDPGEIDLRRLIERTSLVFARGRDSRCKAQGRRAEAYNEKRRGTMQRISKSVAVLALGLAVSTVAMPSFAMSGARGKAVHSCTSQAGKLKQYVWGDHQIAKYRTCMTKHHQAE